MMMFCFFFFKQKTAYEMRISDWSSDVCSSDLVLDDPALPGVVTVISEQASTMATNELGEEVPVWRVVVSRMHHGNEIGRASCRERVCQYGEISVVAVSLKKKQNKES